LTYPSQTNKSKKSLKSQREIWKVMMIILVMKK